jgi:subtilisin-like proprotein convertase family protein
LTQFPYRVSGIIWGDSLRPGWYTRGSGTVAANPKIAVSCAHVTFEDGQWLQGFKFAPAYFSSAHPDAASNKTTFRGTWHWTSYAGGNSNSAFSNDFVAHYAYSNLANGAYSGWWWNNSTTSHQLQSSRSKLIVGYPGSDGFYMNSTGTFTSSYSQRSGRYFWNSSVKGGSGMSGGGVFVDYGGGDYRLSGVHVSGSTDGSLGAGVRALDESANSLMNSAITSAGGATSTSGTTRTFSSSSTLNIPDNSSTWTVRNLSVSSMPASISSVKVSLKITHTYRGDLEVTLTSPSGRIITLHNRTGSSADNLVISDQDVSSSFSGSNPNGTWKLSMRDLSRIDTGWLNSVSLTITSR